MNNVQTIAVSSGELTLVPVVEQEDLPVVVKNVQKTLTQEARKREKYIQSIKKFVTQPYDNINNPVPFIPSRA